MAVGTHVGSRLEDVEKALNFFGFVVKIVVLALARTVTSLLGYSIE